MRFTRYREVEKKKDVLLSMDWALFGGGGFLHLGKFNWTVSHRFWLKGYSMNGTEKEFIIRFQVALDRRPRFSWVTLELVNPFEARWFIFVVKLAKSLSFQMIFNLGWRLSRASRDFLEREAVEFERMKLAELKNRMAQIKPVLKEA